MAKQGRIGILTGGGDCAGLNAVIRIITKAAINDHHLEVLGFEDGFLGLIENHYLKLTDHDVSGILSRGGTILGTSNRANPFHHPVTQNGKETFRDVSELVKRNVERLGLDGLIAIGGDGTLKISLGLQELGLKMIGVPKTIDNDLSLTDYTFGFDSAVACATDAVDRLHTTAESHHRVMILEVMGRYAGWIALYSGVAGGGDIILIPEISYNLDKICAKIKQRNRVGKHFSIVVVAEGACPDGGRQEVMKMIKDSPDPIRLGGIGKTLADEIESRTGLECRYTVLGHLQRGGSPTAFDRLLATRFGYEALQLLCRGEFGKMVAFQGNKIKAVSIKDAVGQLKKVPRDHSFVLTARAVGTSFGD